MKHVEGRKGGKDEEINEAIRPLGAGQRKKREVSECDDRCRSKWEINIKF